jgi:hypothetical protein
MVSRFPMIYLFGFSLFCLLLATRLSGPFRAIPLLIAAPVLLAVIGSVLMSEFALSMQAALLLACLALVAVIGLPLLITQFVTRRAEAVARERRQRLAALQNHLQG